MSEGVLCFECKQEVDGAYLMAFGHTWHKNHLKCRVCQNDFSNQSLYEGKDGHPYCKNDFIETFAPKCSRCNSAIVGKVLKAMGKIWHPHHFTCSKCDTPLVGKGKYGMFDGQPFCPIHTPLTKEEEEEAANKTKEDIKKKHDALLTQIDLVSPDSKLAAIEFNSSDPMETMGELVEALSLGDVSAYDLDLKKAALGKAIGLNDFQMVNLLFDWIVGDCGSTESKSAAIQTLWQMGEIEPKVFEKCAEKGAISKFVIGMIESQNPEAIFLAVTFLAKMCSHQLVIPDQEFDEIDEKFIDHLLAIILRFDVEDDGEPENVQSLMVSRASISCIVALNFQFSNLDNKIISRLMAHEMCTTLASRILTKFNLGLDGQQLRVMVKFFNDVFDLKNGLFFTSDLKVVIEICVRMLLDAPDLPLDILRRGYLDLIDLFLRSGMYTTLEHHRVEDLKKALEYLTNPEILDPYISSRSNSLLYDHRAIF